MHRGMLIQRMEEIQKFVNGDVLIPLPELDRNEKSAIPNLIEQGLSQLSQRIASVMPDIEFPVVRPGFSGSEKKARDRRLAALGWWDMNKMQMILRQRSRYLLGYGTTPAWISPVSADLGDKRDIPHWNIANPLHVFPAPPAYNGDIRPHDVIVCNMRPLAWLSVMYPGQSTVLAKGGAGPDTEFEVLTYNDGDETVMVAVGQSKGDKMQGQPARPGEGGAPFVQLGPSVPNRAGVCTWVAPYRLALDKVMGHFDSITGMYLRQAKMDALETIASTRAIFPDEWLVSHPNAPMKPKIVQYADGRKGVIGEVENGVIQVTNVVPPQSTGQAIDRLERAQRVTAGIPSDFGGESATNIRTARRGSEVMGATVDMPIMEYQDILANSLEAENEIAVAVMKKCYGSKSTSFYIPRDGKVVHADYTPNAAFETDMNFVKWSMPGADVNSLVIALGQRVGFGEMSIQTAQEMDPAIEDPARERNQIANEALTKAFLQGLETQASQPGFDPSIIARIAVLHASDEAMTPAEAFMKVWEEEHQKQQAEAAQAPPAAPPGPGIPGAPPGMGGGSPMMQAPPGAAIGPAPQSATNLADVLKTLRRPQQLGPAEQQAAQAVAQ